MFVPCLSLQVYVPVGFTDFSYDAVYRLPGMPLLLIIVLHANLITVFISTSVLLGCLDSFIVSNFSKHQSLSMYFRKLIIFSCYTYLFLRLFSGIVSVYMIM